MTYNSNHVIITNSVIDAKLMNLISNFFSSGKVLPNSNAWN